MIRGYLQSCLNFIRKNRIYLIIGVLVFLFVFSCVFSIKSYANKHYLKGYEEGHTAGKELVEDSSEDKIYTINDLKGAFDNGANSFRLLTIQRYVKGELNGFKLSKEELKKIKEARKDIPNDFFKLTTEDIENIQDKDVVLIDKDMCPKPEPVPESTPCPVTE